MANLRARFGKPIAFGLTAWALVGAAVMGAVVYGRFERVGDVAIDYRLFVELGHRWAATGSMYAPYQLAGPFAFDVGAGSGDPTIMPALYPPIAAPIFWSLTLLPAVLWWAIPIVGLAIAVRGAAPWTWPLLPLVAWIPAVPALLVVGGSSMWVVAGLALGVRYGWPVLVVAFKPTLAVFAIVGLRRRSTWVGLGILAALSVLFLPEWFRYLTVLRNLESPGIAYSVSDLPLLLVAMLAAWTARARERAVRPAAPARSIQPAGPSPSEDAATRGAALVD